MGVHAPRHPLSVDSALGEALAANAQLELHNHPQGHHCFDLLDDNDRTREIIARTIAFVQTQVL